MSNYLSNSDEIPIKYTNIFFNNPMRFTDIVGYPYDSEHYVINVTGDVSGTGLDERYFRYVNETYFFDSLESMISFLNNEYHNSLFLLLFNGCLGKRNSYPFKITNRHMNNDSISFDFNIKYNFDNIRYEEDLKFQIIIIDSEENKVNEELNKLNNLIARTDYDRNGRIKKEDLKYKDNPEEKNLYGVDFCNRQFCYIQDVNQYYRPVLKRLDKYEILIYVRGQSKSKHDDKSRFHNEFYCFKCLEDLYEFLEDDCRSDGFNNLFCDEAEIKMKEKNDYLRVQLNNNIKGMKDILTIKFYTKNEKVKEILIKYLKKWK